MIEIEKIRRELEGQSEDARYGAWMELYTSEATVAKQELERIVQGEDPILKVLFARFLGRVAEESAVRFLARFLEDANSVVTAQAKLSFERNRFDEKLRPLTPLLGSSSKTAKYFAIEKLSEGGVGEVLDPLLQMLPGAEEELLLLLLRGLRYFSHPKILRAVGIYLGDPRETIRLRAILIVGELHGSGVYGSRSFLLKGLQDESPKIRQAVFWSLRGRPSKRDLKFLFSFSVTDPHPAVRQESLLHFSSFPSSKVIGHLLKILVNEKERSVALRAESVLLGLPTEPLLRGLKKALHLHDPQIRAKALLFIADFQRGSKPFLNTLVQGMKRAKGDSEKISFIEALGVMDLPEAVPHLESCLNDIPLLGYAAAASLLKIWGHHPAAVPILGYLQDPSMSPLLKQIILKQILRKGRGMAYSQEIIDCLTDLLRDKNLNIRYLVAQILSVIEQEIPLQPLIETVLLETDPTLIQFLRESIATVLNHHPQSIQPLLLYYRENQGAVLFLLSILMETRLYGETLLKVLLSLLQPPLSLHQPDYREPFIKLLLSCLSERRIRLEEFLERMGDLHGKEPLVYLLVSHLVLLPALKFDLPSERIQRWLQEENEEAKTALIDLMGLSHSREAVPILVSLILNPALQSLHPRAQGALQRIMGGGES